MRRLLGKNAPEAAGTGRKPAAEVIPELPQKSGDSVELRDARTKLQQAALELRDLRRQQETTKKYENEIANLMRDLRISKEENALLTRRYKMLEEKLGNPDSGSAGTAADASGCTLSRRNALHPPQYGARREYINSRIRYNRCNL